VIELREISRTFYVGGRPVHALRELSLAIPDGDYLSIMGPSGSGKSTLLNLLGCLDRPSSGAYVLDGEEVGQLDESALTQVRRHKIGFVFQAFHLVPRLTAAGNVELPMIFAGVERAERRQRVERALEAVGLSDRSAHRPEQLSGGERQRVAIARAVVLDPAIILADEPTGNLDSETGRHIIDLLFDLADRRAATLMLITHDAALAARCDRSIRIADGRIEDESRRARRAFPAAQ